jgi:hypothetical protein
LKIDTACLNLTNINSQPAFDRAKKRRFGKNNEMLG